MITVVYPYVESYAKFNELLYSIRSLDKHFKAAYKVVIIGDKPEWVNDEVNFIHCPVMSSSAVSDVCNKMKTIIAREDVSDSFIWMNDDIYLTNDISLSEMCSPKAIGDLDITYIKRSGQVLTNTAYRRNMWNTYQALKLDKLPAINTCTHLPFFYNKKLLSIVLEKYNVADNRFLISLLYHNNLYKRSDYQFVNNYSGFKAAVYLNTVSSVSQLQQRTGDSKFFNHSDTGWKRSTNGNGQSVIEAFLKKKFNEKSRFEK